MIFNSGFFAIRSDGGTDKLPSVGRMPVNAEWISIASSNRYNPTIVAISSKGNIAYSHDGVTWKEAENPIHESLSDIAVLGNYDTFVATSSSTSNLISSSGGKEWKRMFHDQATRNIGILNMSSRYDDNYNAYIVYNSGIKFGMLDNRLEEITSGKYVISQDHHPSRGYMDYTSIIASNRKPSPRNTIVLYYNTYHPEDVSEISYDGCSLSYDVKRYGDVQMIITDTGILYGFVSGNEVKISNPNRIQCSNVNEKDSRIFICDGKLICIINGVKYCIIDSDMNVIKPLSDLPTHPNNKPWTVIEYFLGKYIMLSRDNTIAMSDDGINFVISK